jgi:sugar fermentation stimulation protein A
MQVHAYPPLLFGTLVKRYKRFFADIELETGEIITAHCANTGSMTGICKIGCRVGVSCSDNPKRRLTYSWEIIYVDDVWVGVHTGLPNQVVGKMLNDRVIPELGAYDLVQAEVAYGSEKSRIDFVLSTTDAETDKTSKIFIEVKNTTWCDGSLALFPDTVTTRGQKHLRELISIKDDNTRSVLLYFINRGDCDRFAPGDRADPEYGKLLRSAIAAGVEVMPCSFDVTPDGIEYLGLAELVLGE